MPKEEVAEVVRERKTILAIDDDLTTLTLIRKILEKDYDVCLAKSADSALYILNNTGVDLILLDMEMPTMSGLDFMGRLRESKNHYYNKMPIIFVTSHGTKDILVKVTKSGANDFIVKPVNPKIILQKVAAILRHGKKELSPHDYLLKQLHLMTIACKSGNNARIEKLAAELKTIKYNYGTDSQIDIVCRKALNFDYPAAIRIINTLLKHNLYNTTLNSGDDD